MGRRFSAKQLANGRFKGVIRSSRPPIQRGTRTITEIVWSAPGTHSIEADAISSARAFSLDLAKDPNEDSRDEDTGIRGSDRG